jgi:hypothetical protein
MDSRAPMTIKDLKEKFIAFSIGERQRMNHFETRGATAIRLRR